MKMAINIIGGLFVLAGGIWALQGAGVLPGSIMSGDSFWLYAGLVMVIIGIGLLVFQNRKKPDSGEN